MPKGKKGKKGARKGPSKPKANQNSPKAKPESAASQKDADPVEQGIATTAPEVSDENSQKPAGPSPVGFVQGTKEELSKVVWPDRQQLISESAAVILMVSFLAIFISFIDNLFSWASKLIF